MRQATQGPTMEGPPGTTTVQRRSQQRVEGEKKNTDARECIFESEIDASLISSWGPPISEINASRVYL